MLDVSIYVSDFIWLPTLSIFLGSLLIYARIFITFFDSISFFHLKSYEQFDSLFYYRRQDVTLIFSCLAICCIFRGSINLFYTSIHYFLLYPVWTQVFVNYPCFSLKCFYLQSYFLEDLQLLLPLHLLLRLMLIFSIQFSPYCTSYGPRFSNWYVAVSIASFYILKS